MVVLNLCLVVKQKHLPDDWVVSDNLPDAVKCKTLDESWNSLTDQIENEFV